MNTDLGRMRMKPSSLCLGLLMAALIFTPASAAKRDNRPFFVQLAEEVTNKLLASPEYAGQMKNGRKPRIVIGDIRNNSDDEGVRVEDLFNEIRDTIVASGTARLFAAGELNTDLVIAPELTSSMAAQSGGRREHCFTLQLTITTITGEYVTAHSARRCE
jgi:hypothetical protein